MRVLSLKSEKFAKINDELYVTGVLSRLQCALIMKLLVLCVSLCLVMSSQLRTKAVCDWSQVGNGICNEECNVFEFIFDAGECGAFVPYCWEYNKGNGVCDLECNTLQYNWDDGDCKLPPCEAEKIGNGICDFECLYMEFFYDGGDCGSIVNYCGDLMIGNGVCNQDCNTSAYNWDGGDCAQQ